MRKKAIYQKLWINRRMRGREGGREGERKEELKHNYQEKNIVIIIIIFLYYTDNK